MNKPYVICHMLTSVDGKIDGDFFSVPECSTAFKEYANLRETFDCSAVIYGTTTMLGGFSDGIAENIKQNKNKIPHEDYKAPNDVKNYRVSLKTIVKSKNGQGVPNARKGAEGGLMPVEAA